MKTAFPTSSPRIFTRLPSKGRYHEFSKSRWPGSKMQLAWEIQLPSVPKGTFRWYRGYFQCMWTFSRDLPVCTEALRQLSSLCCVIIGTYSATKRFRLFPNTDNTSRKIITIINITVYRENRESTMKRLKNVYAKFIQITTDISEDHVGAYAAQTAYFFMLCFIPIILLLLITIINITV